MKNILVLHTGGTISMSQDTNGSVTTNQTNPLMHLNLDSSQINIIVEEFFNIPSPQMTLNKMLQLKNRLFRGYMEEGIDAAVITHGTDTLEETAYFLDLTIGDLMPIVVTGAMRSSNEIGSDGIYNFQEAIRVASDPHSMNRGVLVVMNDEIHAARFVTKTHTTNVATFRTPTFGPVGLVTKEGPHFYQQLNEERHFNIHSVKGTIPIIKAYAGMGSDFIDLIAENAPEIDGLVIEALGAGNMPALTVPALQRLIDLNIPIVLVSRCFNGIAEPVYGYTGGGKQLYDMGIMFAQGLNSQKARIKLLVGLNARLSHDELYQFMTD